MLHIMYLGDGLVVECFFRYLGPIQAGSKYIFWTVRALFMQAPTEIILEVGPALRELDRRSGWRFEPSALVG